MDKHGGISCKAGRVETLTKCTLWALALCFVFPLSAQISFEQAVETAGAKYPAVRATLEQASAAAAAVNLARNAYLPRTDFGVQLNRATHNNVFGLLFPQSGVFPGI